MTEPCFIRVLSYHILVWKLVWAQNQNIFKFPGNDTSVALRFNFVFGDLVEVVKFDEENTKVDNK